MQVTCQADLLFRAEKTGGNFMEEKRLKTRNKTRHMLYKKVKMM